MGLEIGGIFGLILLALDIWAFIHIVQSRSGMAGKVIWVLFVLLFPLLGFIAWLLLGPRNASRG